LTIPNSVTSIGEDAFRSCSGLTSVNISNSLTDIGRVFIECSGLEAVTIPEGVESIGESAFYGCTSLTSLTISQSVTSINNKAFLNCGNLETIVVDEHNTTYDSRNHCNAIINTSYNTLVKGCKNTIIPEDITFIGNYAFYGCNNLSITSFPESVSDFGEYAFASATINEIVIPTSVTYIGKSCFSNATINRVEIPYSETPIRYSCREGSYYAYTVFTEATIGTLIIDRLFSRSQDSSSEYVAPFFETKIDKVYEGIHGKNWYSSSTIQDYYYPEGITDVKQNSSFKYQGSGLYYSGGNSTIERLHIPEGVTTITKIYQENPDYTSVNIPSTVTTIAADAFEPNMYNTLVLPAGIQSIGERAFANITSVKSITCLAENPIKINENVFPSNAFTKPLYVPVGSKGLYEAASGWSNFSNIIEIGELGNPIQFADPEVKNLCVKNYDVNGDGELSEGEALLVTSINFATSNITSFNELGTYFTNLTSIGDYAFSGCRNLTSVTIPNSVTTIGERAFESCTGLTSVTIHSNVTSISTTAFAGSGLSTILVDSKNTTYDSRDNCNAIIETASNTLVLGCKNTVIPNSVTSIGEFAFSGCSGLTALNIPNSVTSIGNYAFESCNGLTSVTIPSSVTSIGNDAFQYCRGLTSVTIPSSVTSIGNYAFEYCSGLTSVTIDRTQPLSIDSYTFSNRANATLYVPAGSKEAYEAADYWKEFKEIKESTIASAADGDTFTANLPEGVEMTFKIISESEKTCMVGDEGDCIASIRTDYSGSITIPSVVNGYTVTTIGDFAFFHCESLTSISIPKTVTIIKSFSFDGCWALTSITLPSSVLSIGKHPFVSSSLTSIVVEEGNERYDSRDNCNAIIETATNKLVRGCLNTVIPNSVTSIGDNAFDCIPGLTSIEIPNRVTCIGGEAFCGCGLESITIPSSVTSIGSRAFYHTGLTSITIPSSVVNFDGGALTGCTELASIVVESGNTVYDCRDNCNAIVESSTNTLIAGCKNTIIPNTVTRIGSAAFYDHNEITTIAIPSSVTSLGNQAFRGSGLTSINIPEGVTNIEFWAFGECHDLTSVTVNNPNPISLSDDQDLGFDRGNAVLYVPAGSKEAYEAADYWKEFKEIKEIKESNIYFADANVKALCVENWDTDGDGELSEDEAAAVTELGEVFKGNTDITSFDELQYFTGLTSIGENAFDGCENLTSIVIPNTVTTIGVAAFNDTGFENFTVPGTVTTIDWGAFTWNSSLKRIVFEEGVESVGNIQFYGCSNLEEVVFPSTLTGGQMLDMFNYGGANKLTHIVMPINWPLSRHAELFSGGDLSHSVLFTIPAGSAKNYLQKGYYNISDNSELDWMREEFEAEATRVEALKTAEGITASTEAKEALEAAITTARSATNNADSYLAIGAQINAIKSAAKTFLAASTITAETDVTAIIRNPQFDRVDMGWNVAEGAAYQGCSVGYQNDGNYNEHTNGEVTIHDFLEAWWNDVPLGDGGITQTIGNLPAGRYRLECDAIVSWKADVGVEVTGVNLFAGAKKTPVATEDEKPQHFTVDFTQDVTGDCTIGIDFSDTNANWVAMDNIRLLYLGEASLPHVDDEEDNVLYAEERTGLCGGNITIPVLLKTDQDYAAMECQVTLPEGFTLRNAQKGDLLSEDHQLTTLKTDDNIWQILVYTTNRTNFSDTEGVLLELTLGVDNNVAAGNYEMILSNIVISDVDLNQEDLADTRSNIVIDNSTQIGDATNDGRVNVTDIMAVANWILKIPMTTFNEQAADVNGDGRINVTDIMGIANIILKVKGN